LICVGEDRAAVFAEGRRLIGKDCVKEKQITAAGYHAVGGYKKMDENIYTYRALNLN
jgi:hypothetical protein